jgi:cyclase
MQKVSAHVFVETEFQGCNCGFITTREGVIMVDAPMIPSDALAWRTTITGYGEVRYLINTEHHIDHIIGNGFFEVPIIAHEITRTRFYNSLKTVDDVVARVRTAGEAEVRLLEGYQFRPPGITFEDDRLNLYLGDHHLHLIRMAGHLPNEIVVYIPQEGVIFSTDNVFHNCMPWLHESYPHAWIATLQRLKEMDWEWLVPGHGGVMQAKDKPFLDTLAAYIQEVLDTVQQAIDAGKSREEAATSISFIDRFPIFPYHHDVAPKVQQRNVARVYDVLVSSV